VNKAPERAATGGYAEQTKVVRVLNTREVLERGPQLLREASEVIRVQEPGGMNVSLRSDLETLALVLQKAGDVPRAVQDALALCARKAGDYNKHTGRDAYFPLGLPSYAQMIHTKAMRLVNLAATRSEPNFESVRDTCLDLINYAWFLADAVERGEVK
jgi:hypothetical protein